MKMTRKANIFVNDKLAGTLIESSEGEFVFQYEAIYLNDPQNLPISLTMPKRKQPYHSPFLFPFFDGLIPEGWLLDIASVNWKINPRDRMGLLLHLCQDAIGNVSVIETEYE